ncbi:GH116 family glycosyl hydrolase [Compostibacter hankyongensis]|uniref:Non-lysosomal glucosylceramidase n=1 Tax=Compostibacter hankyongensis TaxID=1007089 RepID=A0ABP8FSY0_9BACT
MTQEDNRRSFLKKLTLGSIGVAVTPSSMLERSAAPPKADKGRFLPAEGERQYNGDYTGAYLNRLAFPLGGMGAGMFCLEGTGAVSHMSVRHHPAMFNEPGMFAALAVKGQPRGVKVIEGPVPGWKKFGKPGSGNGDAGATYGLPRFGKATFTTRFPFGVIQLADDDIPFEVELKGWSPFIPTDEDNSSLPVAVFEYRFTNKGKQEAEAVFSYNARNFMAEEGGKNAIKAMERGFVLSEAGSDKKPFLKGDFAIFTDDAATVVDHCWFRGGWWDPLTMAWNTIKSGNTKQHAPVPADAPGASLFVPFRLRPGAVKTIRLMMAWYVPDSDLHLGPDVKPETGDADDCDLSSELGYAGKKNPTSHYKPWYSSRFGDVAEVVRYWKDNYGTLYKNSALFEKAFYASSLPPEVTEAIAANLSILKSPTVLRQYDGRLWSFEGCGDNGGCCEGSCTHVWNYAQAVPHLFPSLERTLRNTEFCEDQNAEGHQNFRAALPIRAVKHDFHAAADGQLGGIMKVYRDWRVSADHTWLRKIFPLVRKSMDYCIKTWDPRHKGVVEEPHHNTYDIEFWGPDGMCTSFYLGALTAISEMGRFLNEDVSTYQKLYAAGKQYMEQELYNGEYFIQRITFTGLNAPDPAHEKSFNTKYSDEALRILKQEGPKYQYGTGCLADGVLGVWIAAMCGLQTPVDPGKVKSHLLAVHKYNLKEDLSDHANPQRPGYALGNEGGLLLCTWPKGGMLSLPFVYSDEVWTGIEYQVASHLMLMGQVKEGLEIVRACRDRYDGRVRNPFNEYECGSWYARAMSSYGMIQGLTGLRYDAVDQSLHLHNGTGDFTAFLSTATGFGTVSFKNGRPSLQVAYGSIPVKEVFIGDRKTTLAAT